LSLLALGGGGSSLLSGSLLLGSVLVARRAGLPGELNTHLPLLDLLAAELLDGTISLLLGGEVDEGITDGTTGARVGGNGGRFTVNMSDHCRHHTPPT
jgi:hypothetical protein